MTRRLLLFALLMVLALCPTPSLAVVSVIQDDNAQELAADTSLGVAYGINNTATNASLAVFWWTGASSSTTITCSDTANGAYTLLKKFESADNEGTAMLYRANIAAGANTVTCSSTSTYGAAKIYIAEIGGVDTTSPVFATSAGQNATSGTGTDNATSTAITPDRNGCLFISSFWADNSTTITAGTGFTSLHEVDNWDSSTESLIVQSLLQTTAGAQAGLATIANSTVYSGIVAAFQPPAGGAAATPGRMLLGVGQ